MVPGIDIGDADFDPDQIEKPRQLIKGDKYIQSRLTMGKKSESWDYF